MSILDSFLQVRLVGLWHVLHCDPTKEAGSMFMEMLLQG